MQMNVGVQYPLDLHLVDALSDRSEPGMSTDTKTAIRMDVDIQTFLVPMARSDESIHRGDHLHPVWCFPTVDFEVHPFA